MDLLCERCGEPYDRLSLTDDFTTTERRRFLASEGCPSCYGNPVGTRAEETAFAREAQVALREVLGDDLDGLAAMMEDFGLV
ncbi:MAG: hypothetical protein ABIH46_08990 [Chloroflexota bacterium]